MTYTDSAWDENMPALLGRAEVAALANVNPRTVDVWRKSGKLAGCVVETPGGQYRYRTRLLLTLLGLRS